MAEDTPLRCTKCASAEVTELWSCPECFGVCCLSCLLSLPRSKVTKAATESSAWSANARSDCCRNSAGVSDVSAPCPTCKRRVEFREVCSVSPVVRRLCGDLATGSDASCLQCVVCGDRAFNNRTCPSCAVVYCSICLEQWRAQCAKLGEVGVSCASCRSVHGVQDFLHDRFAAKLCRLWPRDQDEDASAQPKARRRKVRRTNGFEKEDGEEEPGEKPTDGLGPWAHRSWSLFLTVHARVVKRPIVGGVSVLVIALLWLYTAKTEVSLEKVATLSEEAVRQDRQGDTDGALKAYEDLRRIREQQGMLDSVDGAMLLHNIGVVKGKRGDVEGALEAYKEAWATRERTGSLDTADGAHLLYNIGVTRGVLRDVEGALEAYEEARRIRKVTNTLETPEGMELLRALFFARSTHGNYTGEEEGYEEIRRVLAKTGALETNDNAMLLHNAALLKGKHGDVVGALQAYQDARRIRERIGTLESIDGAHLLFNMGVTKGVGGDVKGALEAYELAKRIRERTGTLDSPEGRELVATLKRARSDHETYGDKMPPGGGAGDTLDTAMVLHNIAVTKGKHGDIKGALAAYNRARQIRIRTRTLETVDGAHLLFNIGVTQGANEKRDLAVEAYEEAWRIHRRTHTVETKQGLLLLRTLAREKGHRGDIVGQNEVLKALKQALANSEQDTLASR